MKIWPAEWIGVRPTLRLAASSGFYKSNWLTRDLPDHPNFASQIEFAPTPPYDKVQRRGPQQSWDEVYANHLGNVWRWLGKDFATVVPFSRHRRRVAFFATLWFCDTVVLHHAGVLCAALAGRKLAFNTRAGRCRKGGLRAYRVASGRTGGAPKPSFHCEPALAFTASSLPSVKA
jgi:hypothetical protein